MGIEARLAEAAVQENTDKLLNIYRQAQRRLSQFCVDTNNAASEARAAAAEPHNLTVEEVAEMQEVMAVGAALVGLVTRVAKRQEKDRAKVIQQLNDAVKGT